MGKIRLTLGLLVLILLDIVFFETKTSGLEKGLKRVKLSAPVFNPYFLPFFVGNDKGIFQKEGSDVEILMLSSKAAIPALVNGNIDYASQVGSVVRGAALGLPIKVIFVIADRPSGFVVAQGNIRSMKELKGKKIAAGALRGSHGFMMRQILKYHGLDPEKDVSQFQIDSEEGRVAAIKGGVVDAVLVSLPLNILLKRQGFHEIFSASTILSFPYVGIGTSNKKMDKEPLEIKRFIKGLLRTISFVRDNKGETVDYLGKKMGVDKEMAMAAYEELLPGLAKDGYTPEKEFSLLVEMEREDLNVKGEVPPSQVVNFSILREAQRELGLAK